MNKRLLIPGTLTLLNLFCGFLSIRYSFDGHYLTAAWLIILAAVFDALDGAVARLIRGYSQFGIEFDSLADVISFGAAPSFLLYSIHFQSLGDVGVIISFMPLFFGAVRLARFNVLQAGFEKENYLGLPIPMQAIALASYVIFCMSIWGGIRFPAFLVPFVVFLSFLMVSHFEYEALPKFTFRKDLRNTMKLSAFLGASLLAILFPQFAIFPLTLLFVLIGFVRGVLQALHGEEEVVDIST
jgi:CDP-diacylglycerol--serine O-phosphatidyltransferase